MENESWNKIIINRQKIKISFATLLNTIWQNIRKYIRKVFISVLESVCNARVTPFYYKCTWFTSPLLP